MWLWRQRFGVLHAMSRVIATQQTLIDVQKNALDQAHADVSELQLLILESHRACRDIAVGARLASEQGKDINEDLDALISDLSDSIANMEEYMVARV